jgi:hypothetical protein
MADHLRKQIRDKVTTTLTGLTTTGTNVFQSRKYPQGVDNLPGLLIYTVLESSGVESIGPAGTLTRYLDLVIEAQASAISGLDNTLDLICKEVEAAICADPLLNGLSKDLYLASTEIDFDVIGEKPVGIARLTFRIEYATPRNNPTTTR